MILIRNSDLTGYPVFYMATVNMKPTNFFRFSPNVVSLKDSYFIKEHVYMCLDPGSIVWVLNSPLKPSSCYGGWSWKWGHSHLKGIAAAQLWKSGIEWRLGRKVKLCLKITSQEKTCIWGIFFLTVWCLHWTSHVYQVSLCDIFDGPLTEVAVATERPLILMH